MFSLLPAAEPPINLIPKNQFTLFLSSNPSFIEVSSKDPSKSYVAPLINDELA